jgi:hypothetical protein
MTDPAEYAREVETYLCRKNEGHLIRIVGPAFEQVCGWARQGVPLKIAFRGIDRYCERYYAKGPRRRPVRIEFCEADILDLFDDWRRAVGVTAQASAGDEPEEPRGRRTALASHLERVIARLTALRAGRVGSALTDAVDSAVRELDGLAADARHARGEARDRIVERLAEIDRALLEAAGRVCDAAASAGRGAEAEPELAPFGSRMTPEARERAAAAAMARLLRESFGLPVIRYD